MARVIGILPPTRNKEMACSLPPSNEKLQSIPHPPLSSQLGPLNILTGTLAEQTPEEEVPGFP